MAKFFFSFFFFAFLCLFVCFFFLRTVQIELSFYYFSFRHSFLGARSRDFPVCLFVRLFVHKCMRLADPWGRDCLPKPFQSGVQSGSIRNRTREI